MIEKCKQTSSIDEIIAYYTSAAYHTELYLF